MLSDKVVVSISFIETILKFEMFYNAMQQIRTLMAFQDSDVNQSFAIIMHTDV